MRKVIATALVLMTLCGGTADAAQQRWISDGNKARFARLFTALLSAYEKPSAGDDARIDAQLEAIRKADASDYEIASAIAGHWRDVYLDDDYPIFVYHDGETEATALEQTSLQDSAQHAFVVLGYELMNGEMQPELKGRCEAAAAAARSFPSAIIVCSGGATGDNNPRMHTEAGLMRDYLVERCGIEDSRIHIDESAMTTLQNASNTLEMLQKEGVRTMTIVTSTYHQRWGQAVYNAVVALYRRYFGYSVEIVANYCYDIEPSRDMYRRDDRMAIRQISQLLNVPMDL